MRGENLQQTMRVTTGATRLTSAALVTALAAAVTWSGFIDVPIHVDGHGVLHHGDAVLVSKVSTLSSGYVAKLLVRPGDQVEAGQVLVRLALSDRVAEVEDKQRQLDAQRRVFERKQVLRDLDASSSKASFARQTAALDERIAILGRKLDWLQQRYAKLADLERLGALSQNAAAEARMNADAAEDELASARAQREQLFQQQTDQDDDRQRIALEEQLEIDRLSDDLAMARELLEAESVVKADVSGTISSIDVSPGSLVTPGKAVAEITPVLAGKLQATVFVPFSKGKRIRAEDRAMITPDDLPLNQHAKLLGRVSFVSDVPASSDSVAQVLGNDALVQEVMKSGPAFEVRVEFDTPAGGQGYQWTTENPPDVTLTAGTPLTARLTVEHTPLLSLLIPALRPLLGSPTDEWTGQS